jgi:hypothetical protein
MGMTTGATGEVGAPTGGRRVAGRRLLLAVAIVGVLLAKSPVLLAKDGDVEEFRDRRVPMGISVPLPPPS